MALHKASDFIFTTGDDLAAIRYPADGETRPALPANALCGYDLAYLTESILRRFATNVWGGSSTYEFKKTLDVKQIRRLSLINYVIDRSDLSLALNASTIQPETFAQDGTDWRTLFDAKYLNLLVPKVTDAMPQSGDPLSKSYLDAVSRRFAQIKSILYFRPLEALSALNDLPVLVDAGGTHTSAEVDKYGAIWSGPSWSYNAWDLKKNDDHEASDGVVWRAPAASDIIATLEFAESIPVDEVKVLASLDVYDAYRSYSGTTDTEYLKQYGLFWPFSFTRREASANTFDLMGSAFDITALSSVFSTLGLSTSLDVNGNSIGTMHGYHYIGCDFRVSKGSQAVGYGYYPIITFKDL